MTVQLRNPAEEALAALGIGNLSGQPATTLLRLGLRVAAALSLRAWRILCRLPRRIEARWELARLDDATLHDIGLRRDQIERELKKWLWQE